MGADAPPLGNKGIGDRAFSRYGVATVVMQIQEGDMFKSLSKINQ